MNRHKILKTMYKLSKKAWRFWIAGIFLIIIGIITFFTTPFVVNSVFNISSTTDFSSTALQTKQTIAAIMTYSSYGLWVIGGILSFVVGEIFAGYAIYESVKLKNYDKENLYYDYSLLAVASAFLLPFIFLNYLSLQVSKEIKYFERSNPNEYMVDLISEEEFNSYDPTAKLQYLTYLLENNVIDEDEFVYLKERENLKDIDDKHRDFRNSDDQVLANVFEEEDEEAPQVKDKKSKKKPKPIYYELEKELPPINHNKISSPMDQLAYSDELNKPTNFAEDDQEYIKKLKEETN